MAGFVDHDKTLVNPNVLRVSHLIVPKILLYYVV